MMIERSINIKVHTSIVAVEYENNDLVKWYGYCLLGDMKIEWNDVWVLF